MTLLEVKVDPELRDTLKNMPCLSKPDWSLEQIQDYWTELASNRPVPEHREDVAFSDFSTSGLDADGQVGLRVYQPISRDQAKTLPVVLWIHGGGFIGGNVRSNDAFCENIVSACNCVVVSVEYRLVPQFPYPAALDDCDQALNWIYSESSSLQIDTRRIAVAGASAGGCLAAALCLRVRDKGGPPIAFQCLIIPVLDDRHKLPSSQLITDPRVWNRELSIKAWRGYLSEYKAEAPIYAAPARASDKRSLPSTFVSVEDNDLLRDEGIEYAQELIQAGVQTELHVYPGTFHGSLTSAPTAAVSIGHVNAIHHAIRQALKAKSCSASDDN